MINIKETNFVARFYKRFYGELPKNVCQFLRGLIFAILAMPFYLFDFINKDGEARGVVAGISVFASICLGVGSLESFSALTSIKIFLGCAIAINLICLLIFHGVPFILNAPYWEIWKKIPCPEINWTKEDQ
jgi:hypothetical protein